MAGEDVDDGSLAEDMMNVEALLGQNVVQMVKDNLILDLLRTYSSDRDRVQRVVSELQRTYLKDDLALYMDEDNDVLLALDSPYLSASGTSDDRIGPIVSSEDSIATISRRGFIGGLSSTSSSNMGAGDPGSARQEPILQPAKLNISAALRGNHHVEESPKSLNASIPTASLNELVAGAFANHRKADHDENSDDSFSTSTEEDSEPEVVSIHEEDRKRKRICDNKSPGKKTRVEVVDLVNSSPKSSLNYEDYLGVLEAMFPDADPIFLMQKFQHIENEQELNVVAAALLESNNYPRIGAGAINAVGGGRQSTMNINNPSVIIKPSAFEVPRTNELQPSTSSNVHTSNKDIVMSEPEDRGKSAESHSDLTHDDILSGVNEVFTRVPQPDGTAPQMPNSSGVVDCPSSLVIDKPADATQHMASTSNQVNIQKPVSSTTSGIPKQEILDSVPHHPAQTVPIPKTLQPSLMDIPTSSALSHTTSELPTTSETLPFPSSHGKHTIPRPSLTFQNNEVVCSADEPGPSRRNEEPWAEKYSILLSLFPQSDPKYLERKAKLLHDKNIDFNLFVETTLENMQNPPNSGRDEVQELPSEPVNVNHEEVLLPLPSGANRPDHRNDGISGPRAANILQTSSAKTKGPTKVDDPPTSSARVSPPTTSSVVGGEGPSCSSAPRPTASNSSVPSNVPQSSVSRPSSSVDVPPPIATSVPGPSGSRALQTTNSCRPSSAISVPGPRSVDVTRSSAANTPGPSNVKVSQPSSTVVPGPSNAAIPGPSGMNVAGPSGINNADSEVSPWSEKHSFLLSILPDADPTFLEEKAKSLHDKEEDMKTFVANALENKDYPTLKDYQRRQEIIALQNKYLNDFNIENFLDIVPEPFKYFTQTNRKPSPDSRERGLLFLKRKYRVIRSNDISAIYKKNQYNLTNTCHELDTFKGVPLKSRRPDFVIADKLPDTNISLQFLQEVAFIENEDKIKKYLEDKEKEEERALKEAREKGELLECNCCFDDEVLARNIVTCPEGHIFCKSCVRKGAETKIGEGETKFSCLTDCQAEFTFQSLQGVLKPTVFSKLAQRKQLEEIKAAGIEDLVQCPFCDFCNIPGAGDKIFRCLNPDCMKDSCIMCKEESHIPLRCDEVEKASEVRMRTYIEDKMTEALVRTCWKCQRKFVKIDGCNKMTCQCGALMCYICRQPVKDYSHFNGQGGDAYHKCPLFSDNNTLHVEAVERVAAEAKAELAQKHPGVTLKHDPTSVPIPREAGGRRPVQPYQHAQIPFGLLAADRLPPPLIPALVPAARLPPVAQAARPPLIPLAVAQAARPRVVPPPVAFPLVPPPPIAFPPVALPPEAQAAAPVHNFPYVPDYAIRYPFPPPRPPHRLLQAHRHDRERVRQEQDRRHRRAAFQRMAEWYAAGDVRENIHILADDLRREGEQIVANRNQEQEQEHIRRLADDLRREGEQIVANRNQGRQLRRGDAGLARQAEPPPPAYPAVPPPPAVDVAAPNLNAYHALFMTYNRHPYQPNPN